MSESLLTVTRHEGDLDELGASWSSLVDTTHPGAGFRAFPWVSSWWKLASTSKDAHVLLAHAGQELVGILPLYAEPTALGGRRLRLMGDGIVGSDYQGAIARSSDQARVSHAFAAHLRDAGIDEVVLDDLASDDPLVAAFAGPNGEVVPRYQCPHVRTAGGDFDEYLRALPDGIGAQWHRRRKWLEKRPGYRIEVLETPADVERGMDILFELHKQRWALEGGSDAIDGPRVETFHREAGRALAEIGWARVYVMHVEGAPRAAVYGFRHGDRFAFYQAGHEPAWRPRSVGTVLLGDVIRRCFEEQLVEFDFLRGSEAYKLRWSNGRRETVGVRARSEGLRPWLTTEGRAMIGRLRAAAKRALPPAAVDWVRARRRELTALRGGSR